MKSPLKERLIDNIVYILIILLIMATLVDLNISFDRVFNLIHI